MVIPQEEDIFPQVPRQSFISNQEDNSTDLYQRSKADSLTQPFRKKWASSNKSIDTVLSPGMRTTQQTFTITKQTFHQWIKEALMKQNIWEAFSKSSLPKDCHKKLYNNKGV